MQWESERQEQPALAGDDRVGKRLLLGVESGKSGVGVSTVGVGVAAKGDAANVRTSYSPLPTFEFFD